jgi:DNA polymerase I-like protein with 3'-5' exonuclease and polymerase domains
MTEAWTPPADPDLYQLYIEAATQWHRDQPTTIAFDSETTGLGFHDRAFGFSLAWRNEQGVYGCWIESRFAEGRRFLADVFAAAEQAIAHNAKFDLVRLRQIGIEVTCELHDTEALAHLDDHDRPKGLKDLARSILGEETHEQEEVFNARRWAKKTHDLPSVRDVGYDLLPRGVVVPYAISDATFTYRLWEQLLPRVQQFEDLYSLYRREMELMRVVFEMEQAGMAVRLDYVDEQVKTYRKRVLQHEVEIEQIVGRPVRTGKIPAKEREQYFNPASSKEVGEYFAGAGWVLESYDAEALRAIKHPLSEKLLEYRADGKLLSTYLIALKDETGDDAIYHPSLRLHGTRTGRTSSGGEKGD